MEQATLEVEDVTFAMVPLGRPAAEATVNAVSATVEAFIACINAGDLHRANSHWTENQVWWAAEGAPVPVEVQGDLLAAPPEVRPAEEQPTLLAISSIRVQPDGRVAAFVTITGDVLPITQLLTFVEQDGRWMIDQMMGFIIEGPQ